MKSTTSDRFRKQRRTGKNRGFSLLEVMISLLVLSVGLAGMAALHLNSLKSAHSSYLRSIASASVLDLEERAWLLAATTNGCPNITSGMLTNAWSANDAGSNLSLPNIGATIVEVNNGLDRMWQADVTLSWTEGRFEGTEQDSGLEQFTYSFSVYCSEDSGA